MNELKKVYMLETTIGKGIEGDPVRRLIEIFNLEGGSPIITIDKWKDKQVFNNIDSEK